MHRRDYLKEETQNRSVAYQLTGRNGKSATPPQLHEKPVQTKPKEPTPSQDMNNTGMPDQLKAGIEHLSGYAMDDVRVHYNSPEPAKLQAHAYAQGSDIHLASGQEKHLPHEAWHVVQQKQGRVQPTRQLRSVDINDDKQLEKEADLMGGKALLLKKTDHHDSQATPIAFVRASNSSSSEETVQRQISWFEGPRTKNKDMTGPVLNFLDFGITPVIVNTEELPGGDLTTAFLAPALLINPLDDGRTEVSVFAEVVNIVGYRMELPADPPWQQVTTVEHAHAALGMAGFGISEDLVEDRSEAVTVEAHGLPSDDAFAALVEQHEEHHVDELKIIITEILIPWDHRIATFMSTKRKFVGDSSEEATAALYEAAGGTPREIAVRFNNALRDAGIAFHATHEGGAPNIDSTTFDKRNGNVLKVYWNHPLS